MTNKQSYLERPEVKERLKGLINATDYARVPPYQCVNCLPCFGEVRAARPSEYKKVARAVVGLGLTLEEVNEEYQRRPNRITQGVIFSSSSGMDGFFDECISPDDLCELIAKVMDKKRLLTKNGKKK